MVPSPDEPPQFPVPAPSPRARDRGLRRSRRTTLWIAATAAAGTAALGGAYTHLLPGGQAAPAPPNAPIHTPSASTAGTSGKDNEEGREEPNGHEDDEEDDDEGREEPNGHEGDEEDDDEGREEPNGHEGDEEDEEDEAPATQPAPQPPDQLPAATQQQPHTTTGAS